MCRRAGASLNGQIKCFLEGRFWKVQGGRLRYMPCPKMEKGASKPSNKRASTAAAEPAAAKRRKKNQPRADAAADDGSAPPPSGDLLKKLAAPGSGVSRGLVQTLAFAEELTRRNEQLERYLKELPAAEKDERVAGNKALRQNIALIKKLYAPLSK